MIIQRKNPQNPQMAVDINTLYNPHHWTDRKDYQHFELPSGITEQYSEMYSK